MKQMNLLKGILAIVVLLCSPQVWAYDFEVDNIQYTVISLDELTAEVSGLSDEDVTEVIIPETVEYKSRTLTVTSIGSSAFYSLTGLESVTIPNSVISIGSYAFYGCSGLTEVSIPNGMTSIGNYAFYNCLGLTGTLTIPNSVIEIGDYAFDGCIRLTEVTIGVNVTTIGNCAFYGCIRLTEVTIPNNVTKIGDRAFYGCSMLTEVNFNATSCSSAGSSSSQNAFNGCSNISIFNFGNNVTVIPDYLCYNLTDLTEITISDSVTKIGSYAFSDCIGLTGTLTIPNSVTKIGDYAFDGCVGLTSVIIGNSVTAIGKGAFYNCSSLKGLDIPNSVTSLGDYAFYGCKGLATLEIGAGMEYLFDYSEWEKERENNGGIIYTKYYSYYYPVLWSDGPSEMESIVLKDGTSNFRVRGYGESFFRVRGEPSSRPNNTYTPQVGKPMFSNINVGYYYVGRPLIDVDSWTHDGVDYEITVSRPYRTITTLEIGGYCTEVPYFYQSIEYLILGENVETYETENIYQGNLKAIICRSAVPPTLSGTFENNNYLNTIVYVPIGSKATYEATEGWKSFWDIQELDMQSIPPGYSDALQSVTAYGQANVIGYYTIDGKKVSTPQRGINIIRYSDGTTRKVLMK